MQEQIHYVVAGGMQLEKLAIQGVRKPGQRMPVGLIKSCERPMHRVPVQPLLHVQVGRDVTRVIVIDKRMLVDGIVKRQGGDCEQKSEKKWLREPAQSRPGLHLLVG